MRFRACGPTDPRPPRRTLREPGARIYPPRRSPHARRGYVLLLVLFVLALAAAAMAGVCRMSLEKAVQAGRAEADLRRRWAVVSCRAVLLPKAEDLVAQRESFRRRSPAFRSLEWSFVHARFRR